MTATMTAAFFTAARVQGRYRVLDEAGQIVVTLNSKAKAEARAAELNEERAAEVAAADAAHDEWMALSHEEKGEELAAAHTEETDAALPIDGDDSVPEVVSARMLTPEEDAALLAQVEADVAMESAMDAECPQDEEPFGPADSDEDTVPMPNPEEEPAQEEAPETAQERQEEPQEDAGTQDTPAQEEKPQSAPEPVEKPAETPPAHHGKAQPAPHAFTTVGTTVKNHCADCGRTWAAAAHRKFREQQAETVEAAPAADTEGEWTPAADDTTEDGKAPAENAQPAQN